MPFERLTQYLRVDPSSSLALVDAIVCKADALSIDLFGQDVDPSFGLQTALKLAEEISLLPENCAMRDGKKWKAIPFIIITEPVGYYQLEDARRRTQATIIASPQSLTLAKIEKVVEDYQDRVLEDYQSLGILVRLEKGRTQVCPALRKKNDVIESEFYYSPRDRRTDQRWVTYKRDNQGIRIEVELFRELIDNGANETELHRFFEENPIFLMQARLGIPVSHRPNFREPKDWKPDFSLSPMLGPLDQNVVELLELKGPSEKVLNHVDHRGFSAKVHRAIDQVRDYERCLQNPANLAALNDGLGYVPDQSKLAVLIGRMPQESTAAEVFNRRRRETTVQVITYDEILQKQASQISNSGLVYEVQGFPSERIDRQGSSNLQELPDLIKGTEF
jgi:hypothetical protein